LIGTEWENESAEKKKELVEQACEEAFANEFITRLPEVGCLHLKKNPSICKK
jgi:ATP-binding cassette subfamily B (MDR/TAP) protein 1